MTFFGIGVSADEEAKERAGVARDAREAHAPRCTRHTHTSSGGLQARLAQANWEIGRVDDALASAAAHFKAPIEAEREALLRVADNLAARMELVKIEQGRFK